MSLRSNTSRSSQSERRVDMRQYGGGNSTNVRNPAPAFVIPPNFGKRPPFIQETVNKAAKSNIFDHDVVRYLIINNPKLRYKALRSEKRAAINALMACIAHHVNLATLQVNISFRNAADSCGLSTISANQIEMVNSREKNVAQVNISRASRAFAYMKELGLLEWNDDDQIFIPELGESGAWLDKVFYVTPLFYSALGITPERFEATRNRYLGYYKKKSKVLGLSPEQVANLDVNSIKVIERERYREKVFRRVSGRRTLGKEFRCLDKAKDDKSAFNKELRRLARERVERNYTVGQMTFTQFAEKVNQEMALLRCQYCEPDKYH